MTDLERLEDARAAWAVGEGDGRPLFSHFHEYPRWRSGTARTPKADCTCWVGQMDRALGDQR